MKLLRGLFLLVLVIAAVLVWDVYRFFTQPLANDQPVVVEVPRGTSFSGVSSRLARAGVFAPRHARYFTTYARLRGATQGIHSGEYEIQAHSLPTTLLGNLISGKTRQYRLTVIEGWRFRQLREALAAHEAIDQQLPAEADHASIMRRIGAEGEHPEGRFLPDTYLFPRGMTDIAFLKRAYTAMRQALEQEWSQRSDEVVVDTPYQALILASIVEKETALPEERHQIAGVFARRLRQGMPLQTDPTVIYGVEDFDGNLRKRDLRQDTPYNTYTRRGLPPTPIALPSRAAIHAALNPAPGEALYFVSRGDGSHVFSKTYEQHLRAVRKYQLQ